MAPFQYLGFVAVILSKATLGLSTPMTMADPNAHTINHPMPLPDASPWRRQSTSGKLREKTRAGLEARLVDHLFHSSHHETVKSREGLRTCVQKLRVRQRTPQRRASF
jgi:hypothetical protein